MPTNNTSIFHVYWLYTDTPAWVPAPNMWVAFNAADEAAAIAETRQHAADRRPSVDVEIVRVEEWRRLPGIEGCEFSSFDRVRQTRKRFAHIYSPITLDSGERGFLLHINRAYVPLTVEYLQLLAFPKEQ